MEEYKDGGSIVTSEVVFEAISNLQDLAGLEVTGECSKPSETSMVVHDF